MFVNPVFYLYGMMDRVTINNEKYCVFNLTYHAFEEPEENLSIKVRFENHKIKLSFIVDGEVQLVERLFPVIPPVEKLNTILRPAPECEYIYISYVPTIRSILL
jgi:hypothetical protein